MITRIRRASMGLAFRIALLLAVALLPIGLIAVLQTHQLVEKANRQAEANLLALTSEASAGEEALIRTAFGAAKALASVVPIIVDDANQCETILSRYLAETPAYSFAGYVNADGIVSCASDGMGQDLSKNGLYEQMRADPLPRATVNLDAPISGKSVIIVSVPVMRGTAFDGYVAISLPHDRLFRSLQKMSAEHPVDLITFNAAGEILSAAEGLEGVKERLPMEQDLQGFVGHGRQAFTGNDRSGVRRVFAVVPIVSGTVYALGSWNRDQLTLKGGALNIAMPILFPALMWIACLMVAFFAVERMVIRPTRNLRARMLMFMRSRHISPPDTRASIPLELREMSATWDRLAENVIRDEAELQDALHDKNVLLKEVHHRVKNNLQLIASILNMKIRKARTPEIKTALNDVQIRVMSLATVHRSLYETSTQGLVRADELLTTITGKLIDAGLPADSGVRLDQRFDEISLYPDQAVPLTLAVSEAVTNALKYIGRPQEGQPWLAIRLKRNSDTAATFEICNSVGAPLSGENAEKGSGLGEQLIGAFAQQLDGTLDAHRDDTAYRVTITFPLAEFREDPSPLKRAAV